jgi:glycosyltransferase involved in cell wall biosynthesis
MEKPIHILQIVDSLEVGGAENLVFELTRKLTADGFRVTVCCCESGSLADELTRMGLRVEHLSWHGQIDPLLLLQMVRIIRRDSPQIVHTHLFKSDLHGRLAARLAGVPIVVSTLHNCDRWAKNIIFGFIYGLTTKLADRLIAVAEEVRHFAIRYIHVSPSRIVTISNAIQIERFESQEAAGAELRREMGISPDIPLFGIVGRLDPQKDHKTFLESAKLILIFEPKARFIVVGEGRLRNSLENLTMELGIDQSVSFLGMRKDIPTLMAAMDVLVLSSLYEGLPLTLLEGMAAARPIVSTAVNGVTGIVTDGETGFLVPPANPQKLADACIRLIANPGLGKRLGQAGYERAKARYSLDAMNEKIIQLYSLLLAQRKVA